MSGVAQVHGMQLAHNAFFAIEQVMVVAIQFRKTGRQLVERNGQHFMAWQREGFDLFFGRVANINDDFVLANLVDHFHLFTGQVIGDDGHALIHCDGSVPQHQSPRNQISFLRKQYAPAWRRWLGSWK